MSEPRDGGPAFPRSGFDIAENSLKSIAGEEGMSLRDWFAGMALQGFCGMSDTEGNWTWTVEEAASTAYRCADAMLKAREVQP